VVAAVVAGWFFYRVYEIAKCYREFKFYQKQGVVFLTEKFSILTDSKRILNSMNEKPNSVSWMTFMKPAL